MDTIQRREYEKGAFRVVVRRVVDQDPDTSYLDQPEFEDRKAEYERGDFHFVGVVVDIYTRNKTKCGGYGPELKVGSASCWGYESDSGETCFKEEEENLEAEAWAEAKALKNTLKTL